jgi:hypothetical protein
MKDIEKLVKAQISNEISRCYTSIAQKPKALHLGSSPKSSLNSSKVYCLERPMSIILSPLGIGRVKDGLFVF